jgi:hypothetical protein
VPEYDYANSIRNECLDNATTLQNGQFYELIQVHALAGQEWFVQTVNGLYQVGSPAPPAAPINILPGTPLTNGMSDGIDNDGDGEVDENDEMALYYLEGIHVDCQGYEGDLDQQPGTNPRGFQQRLLPNTNDEPGWTLLLEYRAVRNPRNGSVRS